MNAGTVRPGGVTLIAILTWIQGFFDIVAGIVILFNQGNAALQRDFGGSGGVITMAIVYILLGLIVILVARGLLHGSRGARALVTVVQLITLVGSVFLLFASPSQFLSALITGAIALIIILMLWTGRAAAFFRS